LLTNGCKAKAAVVILAPQAVPSLRPLPVFFQNPDCRSRLG
jgi:hypothetical protein